jgi:hypothetical protein
MRGEGEHFLPLYIYIYCICIASFTEVCFFGTNLAGFFPLSGASSARSTKAVNIPLSAYTVTVLCRHLDPKDLFFFFLIPPIGRLWRCDRLGGTWSAEQSRVEIFVGYNELCSSMNSRVVLGMVGSQGSRRDDWTPRGCRPG